MKHFHYIFTGSGLAALMTVYEMLISGKFEEKTILLIDSDPKKSNDRTWCFWDENKLFDTIVSKKWDKALFADTNFKRELNLEPYHYKMIKGLDFYNLVFAEISKHRNVQFVSQKALDFQELGKHCIVKTDVGTFTCNKIFNSVLNLDLVRKQSKFPLLQQHFIGWFIKSKEAVFTPDCATFMDFSVEQKGNTRFMYVLPTSEHEALIEYTLFSKDLLSKEEYESEIRDYIEKLGISDYEIIEKERGNIPMTSYKFWQYNSKNIINIGSAGGWTKASTGYTFKNTCKKSKALVQFLLTKNNFRNFHKQDKFWWYDLIFLDVLHLRNDLGHEVFSSLFKKGDPALIFRFLDEETTFPEDLKVILKCPKGLFVKAALMRIFK